MLSRFFWASYFSKYIVHFVLLKLSAWKLEKLILALQVALSQDTVTPLVQLLSVLLKVYPSLAFGNVLVISPPSRNFAKNSNL